MPFESETGRRIIDYPKLMEYDSCGTNLLFLFESKTKGMCLKSNDYNYIKGTYYTHITLTFHDYHGTITLKN